jgi:hypothetical protein
VNRKKWVQVCRVLFSGDVINWAGFQVDALFKLGLVGATNRHEKVRDEIREASRWDRW